MAGLDTDPVVAIPTSNASFLSDLQRFLREETAYVFLEQGFQGFVVSGGIHATVASLTSPAFATIAYPGGFRVSQSAAIITYANNATTWVIAHVDQAGNLSPFLRVAGTHYLTRVSSTQPALPPNAVWLMKVTTAGGAITAVQSLRNLSVLSSLSLLSSGVINVKDYGARGDGTTDDTAGLQDAFAAATVGSTIYVPRGTYRTSAPLYLPASNVTVRGERGGSTIRALTMALHAEQGVLTVGLATDGVTPVPVAGVDIRDLILDGNGVCRALYVRGCTDGVFHHLTLQNTFSGIAGWFGCTDCTIAHCVVTAAGTGDKFGDGLYLGGCTRMRVLFNTVRDFTRIGIVSEADGATKSADPLIVGNDVSNAHDATLTEFNAGIWCENTNSARIHNNRLTNLYHVHANDVRGIVISSGVTQPTAAFLVTHNHIEDVDYGITVGPASATSHVLLEGNTIRAGTVHTSYLAGIHLSAVHTVSVINNHFGANTFTSGAQGSIFVDATQDITCLTIDNNDCTGLTHHDDSGDVNIYSLNGYTLTSLHLTNQNGKIMMRNPAARGWISNCSLTGCGTTYNNLGFSASLQMVNSLFTSLDAPTATHSCLFAPGGIYLFSNCYLNTFNAAIATETNPTCVAQFTNCFFGVDSFFDVNGNCTLVFNNCQMNEYRALGSGGFLKGNFSNTTFHLRMRGCDFIHSTAQIPLVLWNFQPTSFVATDCVSQAGLGALAKSAGAFVVNGNPTFDTLVTASLPVPSAAQNGRLVLEDNGAGDQNLILYSGNQRFRIDGGPAV